MNRANTSFEESESWASLLKSANDAELRKLERQLSKYSPGTFARITSEGKWRPARHLTYLDEAITQAIDDAALGKLDGLVVSMPPQHGKSELCSKHLPAWYLGTRPDHRVILVSYEADFAAGWGRKARDLLEQHGRSFGVRVSKRSSAAQRWDLEGHDGGMTTAGIGGPITGKGAHLLIIDDPIKNDEQARSATQRQKQWEWWESVAGTRLRPGALTVVIQTRWHRDDLSGRILEQAAERPGRWRQIKLPALAEADDVLGRQPGEALWPEVYSQERLERVKANRTPYYWQALYQQNPIAEGSAEWPADFFDKHVWFNEWPASWQCRVVALDPSKGSDSKFGDYSAFIMLLVSVDGDLYVDARMIRNNMTVLSEMAVELQRDFRPDWFGVEVNQFQQLLADEMNRVSGLRGVPIPLFTLDNRVNKLVRIRRLTPYLAQRRVRFKGGSPGARLLVEQMRDFPNGDHDDGPDSLEMAVRLAGDLLNSARDDGSSFLINQCYT